MTTPKLLRSKKDRQMARRIRDDQWKFMEKVITHGVVWFCPWDKHRRHTEPKENEDIHGLIDGMERLAWIGQHRDWWKVGRWSEKRCARSIRLTEAGRQAFLNWHLYDMEPVCGGIKEPGWQVIPLQRRKMKVSSQCQEHIVHGWNCPRAAHIGGGYLHAEDDDKPYDVDGMMYCGRCHRAMAPPKQKLEEGEPGCP